jgi:hypothetical protein
VSADRDALRQTRGTNYLALVQLAPIRPWLDPLWPKPVWGASAGRLYEGREIARFVASIWRWIGI